MVCILEVALLLAGLWAITTGRLPGFLFGGGQYIAEGRAVRLVGILLTLPLPLAFAAGTILGLLFGKDATAYTAVTELVIVIGVTIVASIAFRYIRRPIADPNSAEALSAKRGNKVVSILFIILLLALLVPFLLLIVVMIPLLLR